MQLTRCWPFYTTLFENKIILSRLWPKRKNGSPSKNYSKQIAEECFIFTHTHYGFLSYGIFTYLFHTFTLSWLTSFSPGNDSVLNFRGVSKTVLAIINRNSFSEKLIITLISLNSKHYVFYIIFGIFFIFSLALLLQF